MATSLGTLTSGTPSSSAGINGAKIRVNLSEVKWSTGKTKVSWSVDLIGRSSSPTKATTKIKLTITGALDGVTVSDVTGNSYDSGSEIISYNNNTGVLKGSCYVYHNSSGKAKIKVALDGLIAGWQDSIIDRSGTYTLTDNMPYTKCGAPTSVTINKSIVLPQDTIKVSWSGATAGTGNPISGYIVYYNISAAGDNPTTGSAKTEKFSSSTRSCEITFNASESIENPKNGTVRGYKIVCGVIAVGTETGYNSNMSYSNSITINSLPSFSEFSMTTSSGGEIIPSIGGIATFNFSAKDNDNQTLAYYYSNSLNGEKFSITSGAQKEIKQNSTFYFWVYDGLEYSEPIEKIITVNTLPSFQVSIGGTVLESINASGKDAEDYIISPTINIEYFVGRADRTYKFSYSIIQLNSRDKASADGIEILFDSNSSKMNFTIDDIRKHLVGFKDNGKYYYILVVCSDGIEEVREESEVKYVTGVPSLIGLYNKSDNSNIPGYYSTNNMASHYSDYLKFAFQRDTGYSTIEINGQEIKLTTEINQISAIFQDENKSKTSELIDFDCRFGFEDSQIVEDITKIGILQLTSFSASLNNDIFSFFEQEKQGDSYNDSLSCNIGTSINLKQPNKNFGFLSSLTNTGLKLKINIGGINSDYFSTSSISSSSTNDTLIFNISKTNIKNRAKQLIAFNDRNTKYSAVLTLDIINDFGNIITISRNITIDFVETSSINIPLSENKINLKYKNSSYTLLSNGTGLGQLVEGMDLYSDFNIYSYNTINKIEVYISRSYESNETDVWNKIKEFSPTLSSSQETYPIAYAVKDQPIQLIGTISREDYKVKYKIVAVTDVKDESNNFIASEQIIHEDIIARQHVPISLEIAEGSYSLSETTGAIKIKYNIVSQGATSNNLVFGEENIKLQFQGREDLLTPTEESIEEDNIVIFEQTIGTEIAYVKLGASTTLNILLKEGVYFTSTKETNFDNVAWYTIFNQSPTVSYRKNYLGINTLEPKDSNIITIGESQDRYQIEYVGSTQHPHCKVIKFHIDANSWDGTTGGNMGNTGGNEGNIPTNLAAIAYTGEIGDLQQVRQDIIIFTGGTAPI